MGKHKKTRVIASLTWKGVNTGLWQANIERNSFEKRLRIWKSSGTEPTMSSLHNPS